MTRHDDWCNFLVVYFTLAQPILLHITHMNKTQYLQKYEQGLFQNKISSKFPIFEALSCQNISTWKETKNYYFFQSDINIQISI